MHVYYKKQYTDLIEILQAFTLIIPIWDGGNSVKQFYSLLIHSYTIIKGSNTAMLNIL